MVSMLSVCFLLASLALRAPLSSTAPCCRNKLLLISFDGFRWDYDQDVDTPNLDAMAQDGIKATYATPPFISITSPSHFTLITGKYVENHGVIHNMWFNTTTGEKKPYYMTQFVNEWWDNGSVPIWITAQRQGLKAGSLHFPGTAATYQGEKAHLSEVEPRFYDYSNETQWRENVDKVMDWFTVQHLDFVALYFGEPDSTGHKYGPDSPQRRNMVKQVDRTVGYIRSVVDQRSLTDHLNIIITADHGMSTVHRAPVVQEITLSKIPGFSFKDLQFHIVDYGPASLLLPKEGLLDKVYNALKNAHPKLHVYKKEEMPRRLHYSKNSRILPLFLYADPGYVINGLIPVQFNNGEHGFDNDAMDMKTIFRAVGPDFKKNLEVEPFETVHVYALMCHLLRIQPEPNDGSLEVTRNILQTKTNEGFGVLTQVFIGLTAAAGFLVVVFVIITVHTVHKRRKSQHRSKKNGLDEKCPKTKQSRF